MTITAVANVQRLRTNRSLRYLGFVRCNIAAMTMAASAGCGIFRNRGVSRMSVKKQKAAAIRLATWLRAPAAMATEVFDRPHYEKSPEKAAQYICWSVCHQFLVRIDVAAALYSRRFRCAERLRVADQHNGERTRCQLVQYCGVEVR